MNYSLEKRQRVTEDNTRIARQCHLWGPGSAKKSQSMLYRKKAQRIDIFENNNIQISKIISRIKISVIGQILRTQEEKTCVGIHEVEHEILHDHTVFILCVGPAIF